MSHTLDVGERMIPWRGRGTWARVVSMAETARRTPLLLLHGGPGTPHDYLEPFEALVTERPVVFYDQLGCGRSDRPDDPGLWSMDLFLEELAEVRAALGLDRDHLLGHSWGGMLLL